MRALLLLTIPLAVGAAVLLLTLFDDATGMLWLIIVAIAVAAGSIPGRNNEKNEEPRS